MFKLDFGFGKLFLIDQDGREREICVVQDVKLCLKQREKVRHKQLEKADKMKRRRTE